VLKRKLSVAVLKALIHAGTKYKRRTFMLENRLNELTARSTE